MAEVGVAGEQMGPSSISPGNKPNQQLPGVTEMCESISEPCQQMKKAFSSGSVEIKPRTEQTVIK